MWYLFIAALVSPALSARLPAASMQAQFSSGRIVGGQDAFPGQFPYQAHLRLLNGGEWIPWCGGSIISNTWIVTAAHCVQEPQNDYAIVVGQHDVDGSQGAPVWPGILNIIEHEGYDPSGSSGFANDIAVIQTNSFSLNEFVQPIEMATPGDDDFVGDTCILSGWGQTGGFGTGADVLQWAETTVISQGACSDNLAEFDSTIGPYHICFLSDDRDIGSCSGDSGGPANCGGLLVGATSWGISNIFTGACVTDYASVYANVGFFRDWIRGVTGV